MPCSAVTTRRCEGDAPACDADGSTRASARSTSSMSRAPAAADALPMGGVEGDIAACMPAVAAGDGHERAAPERQCAGVRTRDGCCFLVFFRVGGPLVCGLLV